jgi:2-oxoglutarate ferredoxin oxidoreductase subunit alpha
MGVFWPHSEASNSDPTDAPVADFRLNDRCQPGARFETHLGRRGISMALSVPISEKEYSGMSSDAVVVRFAGDSGDGVQLTGGQFTVAAALAGNDLATFPDFPAEIRAPQGSTFGVSAFQINFGSTSIETAGDESDVLIAMNPAALQGNLGGLRPGGLVIVDQSEFGSRNLAKAGYAVNPLDDGSLAKWQVLPLNIGPLTLEAVKPFGLGNKEALRCKNMWTLGLALWMFDREWTAVENWLASKFVKTPALAQANIAALKAGHAYGETAEIGGQLYRQHLEPAPAEPGLYRIVTGAESVALGLVAGAQLANLALFFASYPITPASAILHYLSRLTELGVTTFQAEDEIAAIGSAIGASFAGSLGVTSSSGPGIALKAEAIGFAIATELPLVIVNSQRGGPSTGLPTKTEQSDLYQAVYGRNGDASLPVIAARSPSDAFDCAIEACRIATQYMTPVMLLTDGYIANAAEPWKIPEMASHAPFPVVFSSTPVPGPSPTAFVRNDKLARAWVKPGTPGLMYRTGGIEKNRQTGHIDYSPANHATMTELRAQKILGVAEQLADQPVALGESGSQLAVVGWGSTFGPIHQAVRKARRRGRSASHIHVRHIWPLPKNLGALLKSYERILVVEMNNGQLKTVLRDQYLIDARPLLKVSGQPFKVSEIEAAIEAALS